MKYFVLALAAAAMLASGSLVAQESPEKQLEFIRKLRAKGYADLALEKLEELKKQALPPKLAALLPVEAAQTRLALGKSKGPEERLALAAAAEAELRDFVAKNPAPLGLPGRLAIAQLANFQGQTWLNKALREEDAKAKLDSGKKAEAFFVLARGDLEKAIKELPDAEKIQARFDRGFAFIEQARVNYDVFENNKAGAILNIEARKVFEEIIKEDNESASGMLAGAWLIKTYNNEQDWQKAFGFYKQVVGLAGPEAQPAQRWARLFRMQGIKEDISLKPPVGTKVKDIFTYKLHEIQKEATKWLKDYKAHRKSPEGLAVQFELAEALTSEAERHKEAKDKTLKTFRDKLLAQAQKLYADVADSDSDVAEKANQRHLAISFSRIAQKKSLADFKSFDDCFLKARFDIGELRKIDAELADVSGDKKSQLEQKRKELQKTIVATIERALDLPDAAKKPKKVGDAQFTLLSLHYVNDDLLRAVEVGEKLARANLEQSALAAAKTIEAYHTILTRENIENKEAIRERLGKLVQYVLDKKIWENHPVTGVARYNLAMSLDKEDKFAEAIMHLEKLPENFAGFTFGTSQVVFIALKARDRADKERDQADKDGNPEVRLAKEKEIQFYENKALAALKRLKLDKDADSHSAYSYLLARIYQSRFILYRDAIRHLNQNEIVLATGKFIDMASLTDQLRGQFEQYKNKLSDEAQAQVAGALIGLDKLSRYGRAEIEYRGGGFQKVLDAKFTGEIVADIEKLGAKAGPIRVKDYDITANLLGLALRANVQKGNIARAKDILKLLERLAGEEGALGANTAQVLRTLVIEMQIQVRELTKTKELAKLEKTVANFSAFLDDYVKNPGAKGLGATELLFVANCYESLNQHDKAAGYFKQIPPPQSLDAQEWKDLKKKREDSGDLQKKLDLHKDAVTKRIAQIGKLKSPQEIRKIEKEIKAIDIKIKEFANEIGTLQKDIKTIEEKIEGMEKDKLEKIEQKAGLYWHAQLKLGQQLRLSKDFKEAHKVLTRYKTHPTARGTVFAEMELNYLLEDNKTWGAAINQWAKFMTNIPPKLLVSDQRLKELYFTAYYRHAYCWFKYSQEDKVKKAGNDKKYLTVAAEYLLRLEYSANPEGWTLVAPRIREDLQLMANAPLRAVYLELKPKYEEKKKQAGPK